MPYYSTAAEFLAGIRTGNFEIPEWALETGLLVLDDLGAENITEWSREILFRLFDTRWAQRRATIVTTNLNLAELKDRLHERVVSRLISLCVPVALVGQDFRRNDTADRMKLLRSRALAEKGATA